MADGAEVRVHPTGKAVVRISVQSQGQGHETTFRPDRLGGDRHTSEDIEVVHGHTDNTPFGAYIAVVDVDAGRGVVRVRRFIAVDDCGPRTNPMIVEGQIHCGLADGIGMALMEVIAFDESGNCLAGSFMDYQVPTAMECPSWVRR